MARIELELDEEISRHKRRRVSKTVTGLVDRETAKCMKCRHCGKSLNPNTTACTQSYVWEGPAGEQVVAYKHTGTFGLHNLFCSKDCGYAFGLRIAREQYQPQVAYRAKFKVRKACLNRYPSADRLAAEIGFLE
jgi:hypothetical protein